MPIKHKDLTGNELHEPKGAENASANTVYIADGSGSGSWSFITRVSFSSGFSSTTKSSVVLSSTSDEFTLRNDEENPGPNKVYGTDSLGTKRWIDNSGVARYESPEFTGVQYTVQTFAHGLGTTPKRCGVEIRCISPDLNYSVGDVVELGTFDYQQLTTLFKNTTEIGYIFYNIPRIYFKDGSNYGNIDLSKWKFKIWAEA